MWVANTSMKRLGMNPAQSVSAATLATRDFYQPGFDLFYLSNQVLYVQPYDKIASRFGISLARFGRKLLRKKTLSL